MAGDLVDGTRGAERQGRGALTLAAVVTALLATAELLTGRGLKFCGTPDACAYLALGESLSRHRGFQENFLFQYQFMSARLPTHGIEYWRPGTSFLLLLAQPFGGVTLHSSQVVETLAGIVLAAAAWRIAMNAWGDRRLACASYLLCLVLPPVISGGLTADSALFYGMFAAWALALFRVRFRSYVEDGLALVCVAGVSLVRNDAVLLAVPLAVVFWLRRRRGGERGRSAGYGLLLLAGFALANCVMPVINRAVMGKSLPAGTLGAIYLTDLSDLLIYGPALTMHSMLSHGAGQLVKLRVAAVFMVVYRIVFGMLGFAAVLLAGLRLRAGKLRGADGERGVPLPEWAGGAAFLGTLLAVYGLALPAVGVFSALRSFTGLLPLSAALMITGGAWAARNAGAARSFLAALLVFYAFSGLRGDSRSVEEMNHTGSGLERMSAALKAAGAGRDTLVMTADAAQFSQTTGYAAVPVPSNGMAGLEAAVHDLQPGFLLLDEDEFSREEAELNAALHPESATPVPGTQTIMLRLRP